MAMLSARFYDVAVAQQVSHTFINGMSATPDLVIISQESARPGALSNDGPETDHPTAMPSVEAIRVSIYDTAIDSAAARDVFEAAGGIDIRPIQ